MNVFFGPSFFNCLRRGHSKTLAIFQNAFSGFDCCPEILEEPSWGQGANFQSAQTCHKAHSQDALTGCVAE